MAQPPTEDQGEDLFCLCQLPYEEGEFMIGCDVCDGWFHPICVDITVTAAQKLKSYTCPTCARDPKDDPHPEKYYCANPDCQKLATRRWDFKYCSETCLVQVASLRVAADVTGGSDVINGPIVNDVIRGEKEKLLTLRSKIKAMEALTKQEVADAAKVLATAEAGIPTGCCGYQLVDGSRCPLKKNACGEHRYWPMIWRANISVLQRKRTAELAELVSSEESYRHRLRRMATDLGQNETIVAEDNVDVAA